MNSTKIMANYFSSKIKTTTFEGILSESDFIKNCQELKGERWNVVEDVLVYSSKSDFSKIVFLQSEHMPKVHIDKIRVSITHTNAPKSKVFLVKVDQNKSTVLLSEDGVDWKPIFEYFSIINSPQDTVLPNVIDVKKNSELLSAWDFNSLEKFVKRQSLMSYIDTFMDTNAFYKSNIDIVVYSENEIQVWELKRKTKVEYIKWMNVGEYVLYRNIKRAKIPVRYFVNIIGQNDWAEYNCDFSWSPNSNEFGKNTSYTGGKTQKVYEIENCTKK